MGYKAVLNISKIKSMGALQQRYDHDYRTRNVPNADERVENDYIKTCEGTYAEEFTKKINSLSYYDTHQFRSNGVMAYDVLLTYSHGAEDALNIDVDKWEQENLKWIEETFNSKNKDIYGDNVVSVVCHRDESTPHIHAIIIPVDPNGKINAYHYTGNRDKYRYMQDTYSKAMKPFGLERGMEYSSLDHKIIRKMYAEAKDVTNRVEKVHKEPDETIEQFEHRIHDMRLTEHLSHFKQVSDLRNEMEAVKNEYKTDVEKDLFIEQLKRDNKRLNHENQEFIHEFGTASDVRKSCQIIESLKKAGPQFPDKEMYEETIRNMSKIVAWYDDVKKDRKKEKEISSEEITEIGSE